MYNGYCIESLLDLVDGVSGPSDRCRRLANSICKNRESHRLTWDGIACDECCQLAIRVEADHDSL